MAIHASHRLALVIREANDKRQFPRMITLANLAQLARMQM